MLNSQQMAAVRYTQGPLLVLAGAGSGKTRVITHKIAYLLEECEYKASQVVAVTFTNKAAKEMRARIAHILPQEKRRGLRVMTFHKLGLSILKRHARDCGLQQGFSIFDSEDSLALLRSFITDNQSLDRAWLLLLQQTISSWKNALILPEAVLPKGEEEARFLPLYARYQQALQAYNAVDFDDLLLLPFTLLQSNEAVLLACQHRIRHLLVDEYQDTNFAQYQLIRLLTGLAPAFTVVGDDDQSIYAWRGARPENLQELQKDYPRLKVITLEQNYRSSGHILQAANGLIAHNSHLYPKKLWSALGPGDKLRVLQCSNEQDEAEQVVMDLISHKLRVGNAYGDYAILYRSNHQARLFEKVLRQHNVVYHISGGESWFSKAEIKDMLAYLTLLCNEKDDSAFRRAITTPKRGVGEASLKTLRLWAETRGQSMLQCSDSLALTTQLGEKPWQVLCAFKGFITSLQMRMHKEPCKQILHSIVRDIDYETYVYEQHLSQAKAQKRMEAVYELFAWIEKMLEKKPHTSLVEVLRTLILLDMLDQQQEPDKNTVQLSTLHAAKGLEFPYVYLVGMEEQILPHATSIEADSIEEERRLAYVGITRAQRGLSMSFAKVRKQGGELVAREPSRFLTELPALHLEWYGGKKEEGHKERSVALAKEHLLGMKRLLGGRSQDEG